MLLSVALLKNVIKKANQLVLKIIIIIIIIIIILIIYSYYNDYQQLLQLYLSIIIIISANYYNSIDFYYYFYYNKKIKKEEKNMPKIIIDLPKEINTELKILALKNGRSLSQFIPRYLSHCVKNNIITFTEDRGVHSNYCNHNCKFSITYS